MEAKQQKPRAFISAAELAERLDKNPRTIDRWIELGVIPEHCVRQYGKGEREFSLVAVSFYEASTRWPTEDEQRDWYLKLAKAKIINGPTLELVASI